MPHKAKHAVYVMVVFQFLHHVVEEKHNECLSKWKEAMCQLWWKVGGNFGWSELQKGKEGLGLAPSQRDLIVYQSQLWKMCNWPYVINLFIWVLVLEWGSVLYRYFTENDCRGGSYYILINVMIFCLICYKDLTEILLK